MYSKTSFTVTRLLVMDTMRLVVLYIYNTNTHIFTVGRVTYYELNKIYQSLSDLYKIANDTLA